MTYATAFLLFYNFMGTGTIPITMLFPKSKIGYIVKYNIFIFLVNL